MPLFEVAIIENPTVKAEEGGATEKLIFGPESVLAKDGQTAAVAAVLKTNGKVDPNTNFDRCEVLVRPFA